MTTANSISDDDLLLAVRYVLEECDRTELVAFEARLADDPAAQGALVEAVQIVALLQATPTCEVSESSLQAASVSRKLVTVTSPRSWQVASLVAASLLIAVAMFWSSLPDPQDHRTAEVPTTTESPALAQVWTALDPDQLAFADADESHSIDDTTDDAVSDVPDWLLTAVLVAEEQGDSDDTDMDLEEETQL